MLIKYLGWESFPENVMMMLANSLSFQLELLFNSIQSIEDFQITGVLLNSTWD